MACVIPFPTRRPAKSPTDKHEQYAFLKDYAKAYFAIERAKEESVSPTDIYVPPETEILKLLRRIDRRLSKLAVV